MDPNPNPHPCPGSDISDELPPPSSEDRDGYVLGRDYRAASRLNYEHYLWRESLGWDLHPGVLGGLGLGSEGGRSVENGDNENKNSKKEESCESEKNDDDDEEDDEDGEDGKDSRATSPLRIADIACGTSIWLRHVSHLLPPSTILDGYDISLSQCPPSQWLPPNIHLREWDLFTEPYPDMLGVYDVVHVRLLFVVVRENNPGEILENLKKLLKPGGYLQWDEISVSESFILRTDPGVEAPLMERRVQGMKGVGGWVRELGEFMTGKGFVGVRGWRGEEGRELAKAFFDNHLVKDGEMVGERGEGLRAVEAIWEESRGGAVICTPKVVWTGRKG